MCTSLVPVLCNMPNLNNCAPVFYRSIFWNITVLTCLVLVLCNMPNLCTPASVLCLGPGIPWGVYPVWSWRGRGIWISLSELYWDIVWAVAARRWEIQRCCIWWSETPHQFPVGCTTQISVSSHPGTLEDSVLQ